MYFSSLNVYRCEYCINLVWWFSLICKTLFMEINQFLNWFWFDFSLNTQVESLASWKTNYIIEHFIEFYPSQDYSASHLYNIPQLGSPFSSIRMQAPRDTKSSLTLDANQLPDNSADVTTTRLQAATHFHIPPFTVNVTCSCQL